MNWVILLLGIASNAAASILVKVAMSSSGGGFESLLAPRELIRNWPFWSGLLLYGVAFLLYAAALARLPLSVAHPTLTAGAIATVAVASALLFQEAFPPVKIFGLGLIIVGVAMVAVRAS
jgi:small multidrug resistance pump